MATIPMDGATHVATSVADSLVDKAKKELEYLRHYNTYVDDFENAKESLIARKGTVLKDIEDARGRNEDEIEDDVKLWLKRAEGLTKEVTEGKKKCYHLATNCFYHYKQAKALAGKTQEIKELTQNSTLFTRVARSSGLPGIEFYSSANFMHLSDRRLKFEDLKEALSGHNKFMVGLYGLGGTGKTTLAIEVGKEVQNLGVFDKVIFSVVSKDPNSKEIRNNIAKHLNLTLDGQNDSEQAQKLWKNIKEGGKKVLIVLDDPWEQFSLQEIGIPIGQHGKGCCAILLTTRYGKVCRDMNCDETIELKVLNEKDAVDLFLKYAGKSIDDSSNDDFKNVAKDIVKECGRLPVAIVAVASALKSRPLREWEQALGRLNNPTSIHDVEEDLKGTYSSLKLSYDYLKKEEARKLFLLCSLFPEDYEIPIELLTRISIGLRLCGEASRYSAARSHFTPILNELIDSCLLLKGESGAVKMHDLVRDIALWIGNKQVQVVTSSSKTSMENIQYSSWNNVGFPKHFDGRKLEVLLLWMSNNADSTPVRVPDGIFEGMESLKILALMSHVKISAATLFQSSLSLINVQSLAIKGFKLEDISILANFKILESLEVRECSMTELPEEIVELEKLRLLEVRLCIIERRNPFEVIGRCLQLEELYFVSNHVKMTAQFISTFPQLERYQIKAWHVHCEAMDFSICGCFEYNEDISVNFSNEIFKFLVGSAEVLKLGGDHYNREWIDIVPHISSKLVELELSRMNVRKLCCSPCRVDLLKKLEVLDLSNLESLEGLLFDEKLELCNLKSICLFKCSMACLFSPFTARSLKQLETLDINECSQLSYIVAEPTEDHHLDQKSQNDSMFPKLKDLLIKSCPVLEFAFLICICEDLPLLDKMQITDCEKLKYIFGRCLKERDLHHMKKEAILHSLQDLEIYRVPNFISIYAECYLPLPCSNEVQKSSPITNVQNGSSSLSRSCLSCFWPKSNASNLHHHFDTMNNNNQALQVKYAVMDRAHRLLFTPPLLYPSILLRNLDISGLVGLKSLFTLSIASSLKLLQTLHVRGLDTLETIVTVEEHGHDHMNVNHSIFPNLWGLLIFSCNHLEYIFPAFYSTEFKDLAYIDIRDAERLTHVFGKCQADQSHNDQVDLNLPALKSLNLKNTPNIVSICAENYSMMEVNLEDISLEGCPKLCSGTSIDLLGVGNKRQEDLSRRKELSLELKEPKSNHMSFQNIWRLRLIGCKELKFIFSASTSRMLKSLTDLEVSRCEELESIIEEDEEDNKNHMAPHQVWFPELRLIHVWNCKSMRSLFSIPIGKIPRLLFVDIEDAPQLVEVFGWKHGEEKKLVVENVFPKLIAIRLRNLQALSTVCQGIDFQTLALFLVSECPAISFTPAKYYSCNDLFKLSDLFDALGDDEDDEMLLSDVGNRWAEEFRNEWRTTWEAFTENKNLVIPELPEGEDYYDEYEVYLRLFKPGYYVSDSTVSEENNGSPKFEISEEVSKEVINQEDSTTKSNMPNLTENIASALGEGPSSSEKYGKASSSKELHGKESMLSQQEVEEIGNSNDNEAPQRVQELASEGYPKETSNEVSLKIPPPLITEMSSVLGSSSISSPKKPHIATSAPHEGMELGSSPSDPLTNSSITDQSAHICLHQDKIINQTETSIEKEVKLDKGSHKRFAEDDLMRLFHIMELEEGVDMEVHIPHVSKNAAFEDDNKLGKALADLEATLKMSLNDISFSEENMLQLENALNILSNHCSEDGASTTHGLQATIHSLQQEVQNVVSSSKQAYATIDTFNKLEQKEKLLIEERLKRKEAAIALLSQIDNKEDSLAEARLKEAELEKKISKLQAELCSKEKVIKECEVELLALKEEKKRRVSETIGFIKELDAVKKEKSDIVEENIKAKKQLQNMDAKWSSCLSNLKKTTLLLGFQLQQKL